MLAGLVPSRVTLSKQFFEKHLEVAMNGKVRTNQGFLQLGFINIDLDLKSPGSKGRPVVAHLPNVQARSENQEQICILNREVPRSSADRARTTTKQGIVGSYDIVSPGSGYRNPKGMDNLLKHAFGVRDA